MPMTYPERRVSQVTYIEQVEFCRAILERMHDDQGGLSHLTAPEFDAAARIAAWSLFPSVMEALVGKLQSERAISKANDLLRTIRQCA